SQASKPQGNTQQAAEQTDAPADQPVSLAEAARLARANKPATERAAKKYDDDNFPRSTPLVKKKPAEGASSGGQAHSVVQGLPQDMSGKLVLMDFWASWCGPCRAGVPNVRRMQSVYGGEDFMVVSVSEDEDEATWSQYVSAHQMTWTQRFDGDRRFFELKVAYNPGSERLEGALVYLADRVRDRWLPRRQAYTVRGVYSDFKYHDVGEAFYQVQFDGSVIRKWRTTPLWGVGHSAPYGHDGANLDLDSVIRRHGGEAPGQGPGGDHPQRQSDGGGVGAPAHRHRHRPGAGHREGDGDAIAVASDGARRERPRPHGHGRHEGEHRDGWAGGAGGAHREQEVAGAPRRDGLARRPGDMGRGACGRGRRARRQSEGGGGQQRRAPPYARGGRRGVARSPGRRHDHGIPSSSLVMASTPAMVPQGRSGYAPAYGGGGGPG
ncbi:MAG: redoxin domain-containing protein, partial [Firmicutes bacterium]|nr:redoxin domain-containing protein [Bacillota bacterium]